MWTHHLSCHQCVNLVTLGSHTYGSFFQCSRHPSVDQCSQRLAPFGPLLLVRWPCEKSLSRQDKNISSPFLPWALHWCHSHSTATTQAFSFSTNLLWFWRDEEDLENLRHEFKAENISLRLSGAPDVFPAHQSKETHLYCIPVFSDLNINLYLRSRHTSIALLAMFHTDTPHSSPHFLCSVKFDGAGLQTQFIQIGIIFFYWNTLQWTNWNYIFPNKRLETEQRSPIRF